jgi:hypothetical protein
MKILAGYEGLSGGELRIDGTPCASTDRAPPKRAAS